MMKAARKIHTGDTDYSCTSCLYKSVSDMPSLGSLISQGNRIDRLFYGQYIPLREKKLIEKLVRTRAVYDDIRAKLISDSSISLNKKTDLKTKNKRKELNDNEKGSVAIFELIDLVDKGATLECCSCCSCSSKEHLQQHRKPKHHKSYMGFRKQVIQKPRLDAHATKKGVRFKAKHIRSDPCTCTCKLSGLLKNKKNIPIALDLKPITKETQQSKQKRGQEFVRRSYENIKQSSKQIEEKMLEEIKKVKKSKANIQNRLHIDVQASAVKLKQTRKRLKSKVKLSKDNLQLNDLLNICLCPVDKIFEMPPKESLLDVIKQKSEEKIIQAKNKLKSAMKPTIDRKTKTTKIKTSSTDFSPENNIAFQVKKDSIRKFQEELRRKQKLKDWECDPEYINESCVPEECYITLQKKRKNMKHRALEHHTRKIENKTGTVLIQKNEKIQYKPLVIQTKDMKQKRTFKEKVNKQKTVSPEDIKLDAKEKKVSPKNTKLVPKEKIVNPKYEIDFYKRKPNMTSQGSDIPKPTPSGIKYKIKKKPKVKSHQRNPQVLIKHSSRDTQTEIRSLKQSFSTPKLKYKKSKPKHKKKQKVTTAEKSITALESPGAPCKEVDCSVETCEKMLCEKLMLNKLSNTNTVKKIKKERYVKPRYLLPYECEPGVCTPDNCDPYHCIKLINIRETKDKESSISCICPPRKTKSTSTFTSKSNKASKAKIAQSLYSYGTNQKKNQGKPEMEQKYVHNAYGRQAVKIGSTFSFNIEFYKNKTPQPSDLKTFVVKPNLKKISKPKFKERAYQGDVPSIHKNIPTQIYKKKGDESLSTSLKRCFCTLKLQRKSHSKLKRKKMSSTGTKTVEEPSMNIVTFTKATKTKQNYLQSLEPYECEPFTCIPGECNPYECLERINRRNLRDVGVSSTLYRSEINQASCTLEKSLKDVKTQSKPRSREQEVLTKVKKPKRLTQALTQTLKEKVSYTSSAPSKQAVKIGSTFSFNIEVYKKQLPTKDLKTNYQIRPDMKLDTRSTTRNRSVRIENLNVANLNTQVEEIKKRNKIPTTKPLLKRCFCTLNLLKMKNNVRTNPLKLSEMEAKVYTVNRAVVKQNRLSIFRTHCTKNLRSSRSANTNMNSNLTSQISVIKSLYNECSRINSIKHLECLSCYPLIINKNKLETIKSNFNTALKLISQSHISDNLKLSETGNSQLVKGSNNVNQHLSYVNQERKCVDYTSSNFNDDNGHLSGLRQYLKRYYCTMNLQVARNKYGGMPTNIHSTIGNRCTQRPRKLKPYECEPGVCVPGECDPYECLKLISKRGSKIVGTQNTVPFTSSCTSFKCKTNKVKSQKTPKNTKSYLSKSIGINKQSFSNQLCQSAFCKTVQKASATLPRIKRCFCTLKLQKRGRLQKKEHKQPSESIQTEALFLQTTTIDRGQNPHKFKPCKMSSLEPYECQPGICIPGQCNPYECLEIMNKLNSNQTADSGSEAIIEKPKTSASMTVCELKYKTRIVSAKPKVICGSNLCVTPTALRDQESQNKSTAQAVSTMTASFMKRCFCVLKLRKKEKKIVTSTVEIMNKPVTMDRKTNTEHCKERMLQLESYECEPGTCIPGECDPYVCEKIIKRRNNLRSQSSSTALNSARSVCCNRPTCKKNINTQLRPRKSTRDTKNQFYMKIKTIKQRNSETKSPTVSFRSQISQIIVTKRDFASNINNVIKRCFCTLQLYNQRSRKECKKKKQKPIEKKVHCKSVMTTEKNRVNFDSLEPYECEPNFCTPYECDPYECEKRIKLRQRKQHQREIGILTQHCNQHTAASSTDFFMMSQKRTQSMPTPPLKRCFCTFHLKRPKEEPASIPKPKMSNVSTETKIRVLKVQPVTKLLPYECEPNICVPGECNPLECLERIKKRSKQKDYGTSTSNIQKYELGMSMVTNKTINRRSQFKSPRHLKQRQKNCGNQSNCSKQNSKISTEEPFLKKCYCTFKLRNRPSRKVSKISVKTDTKVNKIIKGSNDTGTLTNKYKKKNIQVGPYECGKCDPYRIAARNLRSNTVPKKMESNTFSILSKKSQVNKPCNIVETPRFGNLFNKQAVKFGSNFSFNIEFYKEMLPPTDQKYSKYDKIECFQPRKPKHSKVNYDSIKTSTLTKYQNKGIQRCGVKKDDKALEVGNALKRCFCTLKLQKELNSKQSRLKIQCPQCPQVIEVRRVSVKRKTKQTLTEVKSVGTKAKAKYINASCNPQTCLLNLSPEEMEVILPYMPSKFNKTPSNTMQNKQLFNETNTKPRKTKITNRGKRLTKKRSKKSIRNTHFFDKDVNPLHHSTTKFKKMLCKCVHLFSKNTEPGHLVNSTVKQLNYQCKNESPTLKKKTKTPTMGKTTKSNRRSKKAEDIAQTHPMSLKNLKENEIDNTLDAISHKNQIMVKESGHQKDHEKTKPFQEYSQNEMENFLCSHCSNNIKMKKRHSQPLKVHFLDTQINKNKEMGKKTKAKDGLALLNKSVDQISKHRKSIRKKKTKTDIQSTKIANCCKFCVTCGTKLNNEEIQKAAGDQKSLKSQPKEKTNPKGKEDPSQHKPVSSNKSQRQQVSSNKKQRQKVSSSTSQREQVSSNNSQPQQVNSNKKQRQQVSSSKNQREQVSSNNSQPQQVNSNDIQDKQFSCKNIQAQYEQVMNFTRDKIKNLLLKYKQSDDNICSAKGPEPPLFEMHLDSDDYGILNKDEVLEKIKKFSKKSVKDRSQNQPFYKQHGKSCSCCICLARKNKTGATFSVTPKGTKGIIGTKAEEALGKLLGGTKSLPKTKQPCVCGSVHCAKELKKMAKKSESSKQHKRLKCDCGSPICASEIRTMNALIATAKEDVSCICGIEREKMLQRIREEKERIETRRRAQRLKQYQKEDEIRVAERRKKNKMMEKKVNKNSSDAILAAESIIDIGKLGITACTDVLRRVARTAIDPKQAYKSLRAIKDNPEILMNSITSGFSDGGVASTYRRVRLRCLSMRGFKTVKNTLERHALTNYLLYMFAKDPRKRIAKTQPREREQLDFNCSLFMGTLRKKPYLCIYNRCPWFYPHFVSLINIWKQFMEISLFLIAVLVWSPCILCMEACRAFMCCFLCNG